MAKDVSLEKVQTGAACAGLLLYLANHLSVLIWNYPFLYCWGKSPAERLFLVWGPPVMYLAVSFIIWKLLRGQITQGFIGFIIVVLVMELPNSFDILFRLGGSCHG
ncbi:hypothetical protein ELG77_09095 [Rhizobium leguminosarum]|uniref:hypothetical protein n=1 Tax=Rhizobium leguminosarum TaxID=384 RepID=UPI00103191E4|nr:hypothetical protein [Rhizobium leguminosarum]TBG41916.1 hypothetical protein ELG77_09095 [Rhizobium leguminosarum]